MAVSAAARSRRVCPHSSVCRPTVCVGGVRRQKTRWYISVPAASTPARTNSKSGEIRRYSVRFPACRVGVWLYAAPKTASPPRAMFKAAYTAVTASHRRLLRTPKAAIVTTAAVPSLYPSWTAKGRGGANKISAESAAAPLPASSRPNGGRWAHNPPAASSKKYAARKLTSSRISK